MRARSRERTHVQLTVLNSSCILSKHAEEYRARRRTPSGGQVYEHHRRRFFLSPEPIKDASRLIIKLSNNYYDAICISLGIPPGNVSFLRNEIFDTVDLRYRFRGELKKRKLEDQTLKTVCCYFMERTYVCDRYKLILFVSPCFSRW